MMNAIQFRRLLSVALIFHGLNLHGQPRRVTTHTNFYYFGPVKEVFEAYRTEDGKLVKHGKYRDWKEGGWLWHEIQYKDAKIHGASITYYPNGRKASETMYDEGKQHGVSTQWNRDGVIVARGTNDHGKHWRGTFVVSARYSVRGPDDEDIRFYISEFRNGVAEAGEPKEIFDDGSKWKPEYQLDERRLLRWMRYSYRIDSKYPYLETLPCMVGNPNLVQVDQFL
jgi:hypothetical protein